MNARQAFHLCYLLRVVVNYLDFLRLIIRPIETDPPLIINTNAYTDLSDPLLTSQAACQAVSVSRGDSQHYLDRLVCVEQPFECRTAILLPEHR